jgi:hypothetical protein
LGLLRLVLRNSKRRSDCAGQRRLGFGSFDGISLEQLRRSITFLPGLLRVQHHHRARILLANPAGNIKLLAGGQVAEHRIGSIEEMTPAIADKQALMSEVAFPAATHVYVVASFLKRPLLQPRSGLVMVLDYYPRP